MDNLVFYQRTSSQGKFLYFPQESFVMNDYVLIDTLSSSNRSTMEMVEYGFNHKDSENCISISDLAVAFEMKEDTLRNRIRTLESLGILISFQPIFSSGKKGGKVSGSMLRATTQVHTLALNIQLDHSGTDVLETQCSELSVNTIAHRRKASNDLCKSLGFAPPSNEVRSTAMKQIIRPKGPFPIEQVVPSNKVKHQKYSTSFKVTTEKGTVDVKAEMFSKSRIMNASDLQTLFATYSLIVAYHESQIDRYIETNTFPLATTPVSINHVLHLRGIKLGGTARKRIRESIVSIADTIFDLYELSLLRFINSDYEPYIKRQYKCFEECTPLVPKTKSSAPRIEGDSVVYGDNASLFMITLPEHIFENLISNNYAFAFPQGSLSCAPIIFSLYMRFRGRVQAGSTSIEYVESLKFVHKETSAGTTYSNFRKTLYSNLDSLCHSEDPHFSCTFDEATNIYSFNLWGYHVTLDTLEMTLYVLVNLDEVLKCCNVSSDKMRSPTLQLKLASELSHHDEMVQIVNRTTASSMQPKVGRTSVRYNCVPGRDIVITKYTSDFELSHASLLIESATKVPASVIDQRITDDMNSLRGIFLGQDKYEMTKDDFTLLILLCGLKNQYVNTVEMIHTLNRMTSLHDEILNVLFKGVSPSPMIADKLRLFCEKVTINALESDPTLIQH